MLELSYKSYAPIKPISDRLKKSTVVDLFLCTPPASKDAESPSHQF